MALVVAAQVWHYWIAVPLTVLVVAVVIATIGGYLNKVVRPKYPPRPPRQARRP